MAILAIRGISCQPRVQRLCRDSAHDSSCRNVSGDNCIRTDRGIVSDGDSSQDSYSSTDPHLVAQKDRRCPVPCIADRNAGLTLMICVPNTGILPDHGSATDVNAGHSNQVNAARKNNPIADLDTRSGLRLQVKVRVKQDVVTEADSLCAVDQTASQHDDRGRQRILQLRGQFRVGPDPACGFA